MIWGGFRKRLGEISLKYLLYTLNVTEMWNSFAGDPPAHLAGIHTEFTRQISLVEPGLLQCLTYRPCEACVILSPHARMLAQSIHVRALIHQWTT